MMTFEQAVMEAVRIQAETGAPLADVEVTSPNDHTALAYLRFEGHWHVLAFRAVSFDRDHFEQGFIAACNYESRGATIHSACDAAAQSSIPRRRRSTRVVLRGAHWRG